MASKPRSNNSNRASNNGKNTAKNSSKNSSKKSSGGNSSSRKKQNKRWGLRIAALIILAAILGVSLIWQDDINTALNLKSVETSDYGGTSATEVIASSKGGGELIVHFVDVGQGDASIVELPDGKKVIIDGGKDKEKSKLLTYISDTFTADNGNAMDYFDYAILTHADEDHCGGLDDVLKEYPTKTFYRPNELASYSGYNDPGKSLLFSGYTSHNTRAYMNAIIEGHKADEVIVTNDSVEPITPEGIGKNEADYYEIIFYGNITNSYKNRNDYSPIMIINYEGKRIALSGDAEKKAEEEFVKAVADNKNNADSKYSVFDANYTVDVIKLGHHGSRTSSSVDYLQTLTTEASVSGVLAIVSCGFGNSYKHPHEEVLERLKTLGFKDENVLRTDVNGNIVLSIRENSETGEFELYYGATSVNVYKASVNIGGVIEYTWFELAVSIWITVALALVIQPFLKDKKIRK